MSGTRWEREPCARSVDPVTIDGEATEGSLATGPDTVAVVPTTTRSDAIPDAPRSTLARVPAAAEGRSDAAFDPRDWLLIGMTSAIWGASYLLIAEGLETLQPGVVAFGRLACGFLVLALVPAARRTQIERVDRPRVLVLGIIWLAAPMVLFPIAEQWVSSAVAGMLNGAVPLMAAATAALLLRRLPGRNQLAGLAIGFVGVVAISLPSLQGGARTAIGASLVLAAIVLYGFAGNFIVPLQQRYGAPAVVWRAQLVGLVATAPYAVVGLSDSTLAWKPVAAVVVLGALGTGVAFVAAATVFGRVGATRGSIIGYLIPVVALALGVVLRDEHVAALAVGGLVLVLAGAWLTSRAGR